MHLIISTSLRPQCRTLALAEKTLAIFQENKADATLINIQEMDLPFCDGEDCYNHPAVISLTDQIKEADSLVIASPVYNFYLNAAAKNLLELTGSGWQEKVVGFICNAGGKSSYMSVMPFADSIMLDYRCKVIPKFVYATGDTFDGREVVDGKILDRLQELIETVISWTA